MKNYYEPGSGSLTFVVPPKGKQKEWYTEIAMYAGDRLSIYNSERVRSLARTKKINIDLYNGILHPQDVAEFLNPADLQTIDQRRELKHYPIAAKLIDLLVGEEINGIFEPIVTVVNNVGIVEKQQRKEAYVQERIKQITEDPNADEDTIKAETERLMRELKYTYKDIKEKKASALLEHYDTILNFEDIFTEGYRRVFLTGEELYEIDIIKGQAHMRVVDTVSLRTYGGGHSRNIEDYDVTVIEDHFSAGYLIDRYGDELSPEDTERILSLETDHGYSWGEYGKSYGDVTHQYEFRDERLLGTELASSYVDANGGIRHLRIRWKGYIKYKKVKYRDPVTGMENLKVRTMNYKLQPGEVTDSTFMAVQHWVASLIGYDIVVDARPMPIPYATLSDPLRSHCGLVGTIYNVNRQKAEPMMSRVKSYQYLYDVTIDNMITAMSKNIGPILEMDLATRPEGWSVKDWLHYITKYNVKFKDSFKEINKGPSKGQLAGNLAVGKDSVVEISFGNYIQQLVNMAQYIEQAMANLIGIVPQRLGSVSNRETYGGVERATSQSAHITAWYEFMHKNTKLRALNLFLEAAKHALKDNPKMLNHILPSGTIEMLEVTEDDLVDVDLGVVVTDSREANKHKAFLEQAAQAYMQNGGDFAFAFKIMFSESMAEKRRLIEIEADERQERQREAQQAEQQARQTEMEAEAAKQERELALKEKEVELEKYKADLDAMVKIKVQEMKNNAELSKNVTDANLSMEELRAKMIENQANLAQGNKKLQLEDKKLDIEKQKASQSSTSVA